MAGKLRGEDFKCHLPVESFVPCKEHDSHSTPSDLALNGVLPTERECEILKPVLHGAYVQQLP